MCRRRSGGRGGPRRLATRLVYRFEVRGDENIPTTGAAILVCNHVSFVDAVLLMAASPRPVRFTDQQLFKMPVLGWFLKLAKAIPIAPHNASTRWPVSRPSCGLQAA